MRVALNHHPQKPSQGKRRGEGGFSLVEAIVALAVLAMAIVAVTGILASSQGGGLAAQERLTASELLQTGIQEAQSIGGAPPPANIAIGGLSYQISSVAGSVAGSGSQPNLELVTVKVSWQNQSGATVSVSGSTSVFTQASSPGPYLVAS
jgi:type II secretory pathway pseudopilin PulG